MKVYALGLNHRTAPLDVRELVAVSPETLPQATAVLKDHLGQGLILSTCNRTEVYTLADRHGSPEEEIGRLFTTLGRASAPTSTRWTTARPSTTSSEWPPASTP